MHHDRVRVDRLLESPLSFAGEQIDELLYQWDLSFHNGLEQQIDYEIMDRESGRTFANTERALHYLGTEEESIYLDNYYTYYIKLLNFPTEEKILRGHFLPC